MAHGSLAACVYIYSDIASVYMMKNTYLISEDTVHYCHQYLAIPVTKKLFSLVEVKLRTMTRLTEKHLERCMCVATTEIKTDIERLLKQNCVTYPTND
jgi:hypothetical protein